MSDDEFGKKGSFWIKTCFKTIFTILKKTKSAIVISNLMDGKKTILKIYLTL
jgi:hypothetical protein